MRRHTVRRRIGPRDLRVGRRCLPQPAAPRRLGQSLQREDPWTRRTVRTISSSESRLTSGQMVGRHVATPETPISPMDQ
jgi:hypothetical protein